jgi:hypothetical protein
MVKYAKGEDKPFDPISNKVLSAIASPVPPPRGETGKEATPLAPLQDEEKPETPPEPRRAPAKQAPERLRVVNGKRSAKKRRVPVTPKSERLSRAVKCLFTPSEEQELRALVGRLGTEAKVSLGLSHLMRPYFELLLHCEGELATELRRAGLTRPINDKTAIALFESLLAEAIHAALRKSPQFRSERRENES